MRCGRSLLPRGLKFASTVARLLGLRVPIPPGHACLSLVRVVCCLVCVGLITRPLASYRVWCFWLWSWSLDNEKALAHKELLSHGNRKISGGEEHVMQSLMSQFLTSNYYFFHLTSKYSGRDPSLKYTKSMLFIQCVEPSFTRAERIK
jgi:hypothetical protein